MRRIALSVVTVSVIAVCVFEIGYAFWEFFWEHDGVAFYTARPALAAIVITIAVVSGVVWHLVLRRRDAKERESGHDS
jgi:hypothetical protein